MKTKTDMNKTKTGGKKLNSLNNQIKDSDDKPTNLPQRNSLVKYDTPFLATTTISNKKVLEELDDNSENAEIFLRNIINKKGTDVKGEKSEFDDFSVKDALNKILLPFKSVINDQLWVQYVSCTPVTKAEVLNLQEGLDRRLQTMQARETGICPIREELYNECFDELIRQVTINCLERGILLMRIKKEIEMTVNSYQTLYESAIAYGIRTSLIAEETKNKISEDIKQIEDDIDVYKEKIRNMENDIQSKVQNDIKQRDDDNKAHELIVTDFRKKNNELKAEIKAKLTNSLK